MFLANTCHITLKYAKSKMCLCGDLKMFSTFAAIICSDVQSFILFIMEVITVKIFENTKGTILNTIQKAKCIVSIPHGTKKPYQNREQGYNICYPCSLYFTDNRRLF
jgi:hypothetical protein